ncbi:MAG: hypothetical protein AAFZ49_00090 [Cyanobacteria bacterium J06659_2]
MVKSSARKQNPKAVDTLIGWLVLVGAGLFLFPILSRNISPYEDTVRSLASGVSGVFGWVLGLAGVAWFIGLMGFAAVQLLEIWPLLSEESPEERNQPMWSRVISTRWGLALVAYAIDAVQCARYWSVLADGIEPMDLIVSWDFSLINWGNLVQTILTLFGAAGFVVLKRYVARKA